MTRLRLVCAAVVLLLVLTGTAATVLSALPLDLPALGLQGGATAFEVRLAELQPGAGLTEAAVEGSGQRLYLRSTAVVTAAAGNRLTEATKSHLGRPIAILLGGKVVAAPTLRSLSIVRARMRTPVSVVRSPSWMVVPLA